MIIPNKIKKSQAKHIIALIEQATRAEILARFGRFDNLEWADWYKVKLEKQEELLEYIFGTSSLVKLGKHWGLFKRTKGLRRKKRRHGKSQKD